MMDVREKLVDIVCDATQINGCIHSCNHPPCAMVQGIVDALIENGVTVQEWISVDDRLPEHRDVVLCFMRFGEQRILQWDNVSSWWLGYGHGDDWQKADVTNWMPLPERPKGE